MGGLDILSQLGGTLDGSKNCGVEGIRGRLIVDQPMADVTWFRVGGKADLIFSPADADDLCTFLKILPVEIPVMVVGVGSNLLVRDGGIEGVVIRTSGKGFSSITKLNDTQIYADVGVLDKKLAAAALEFGVGGLEFYHGIPGAIGGALRMNAGANGTETKDRVFSVDLVDRSGVTSRIFAKDMGYSYRHSDLPSDMIITGAVFEGIPAAKADIQKAMDEVQHHRETVQPIREKTGGSTFKNPLPHSSWKLIDEAGLRGHMVGAAQMSEMHCNFMINTGGATAHDLETLGETVRRRVYENSGVLLEWEIKRLGRFENGKDVEVFKAP